MRAAGLFIAALLAFPAPAAGQEWVDCARTFVSLPDGATFANLGVRNGCDHPVGTVICVFERQSQRWQRFATAYIDPGESWSASLFTPEAYDAAESWSCKAPFAVCQPDFLNCQK